MLDSDAMKCLHHPVALLVYRRPPRRDNDRESDYSWKVYPCDDADDLRLSLEGLAWDQALADLSPYAWTYQRPPIDVTVYYLTEGRREVVDMASRIEALREKALQSRAEDEARAAERRKREAKRKIEQLRQQIADLSGEE